MTDRETTGWPPFPFSEDDFAPRGDAECLDAALACLHLEAGKDGTEQKDAVDQITEIATDLNYRLALSDSVPRLKSIDQQLTELYDAISRLLEVWFSGNKMTEYVLNLGLCVYAYEKGISIPDLKRQLSASGSGEPNWPDDLTTMLGGIDAGRQLVVQLYGSGDPDRPDLGGKANLYNDLFHHPKLVFTVRAGLIFGHYQPGRVSGYDGGAFANFTRHVYAYATDKSSDDDGAGLERWIKKAARIFRPCNDLLNRASEVKKCRLEMEALKNTSEPGSEPSLQAEKELERFEEEMLAIGRDLVAWGRQFQYGRLLEDPVERISRQFDRRVRRSQ